MAHQISREELEQSNLIRSQLLPFEREIFMRWYRRHGNRFHDFIFAQRFGPQQIDVSNLPEGIRNWVEHVTRLRADVVCWQGSQPWILEVKPEAKPGAVGQLRSYLAYWKEEFPNQPIPKLGLIVARLPVYMPAILEREGITYWVV